MARDAKFASTGVLGAIFGGWQVGGTLEYQPGPLLTWGTTRRSSAGSTWTPVNMNVMRTVTLPGRSALSIRVDIINLPNRTTFANPNLNPASTDFGRITSATAASPRFIQFVTKLTF